MKGKIKMSNKRKANGIVTFKFSEKYNRYYMLQLDVVTTNGHNITLYSNKGADGLVFETIEEMYEFTIQLIHSNNFYLDFYMGFDSKFYSISWINVDDGFIRRYGKSMHWD